ncbi:MAG TPA: RNA polymerase sigma factor [Bryobacteraceae bacterium]|jgi:RNA polymerase sigma-70 factor (ECF subfamily)
MEVQAAVEAVFRQEHGRIIASLIRISGSFDRAEEAMQEAFAAALATWPERGVPHNPGAWIMAAAHRKWIDRSRRERTRRDKQEALRYDTESRGDTGEQLLAVIDEEEREAANMLAWDDRLRLMFTCCHPAVPQEGQIALTLRMLGGLTTTEIAKAFLVPEATMAQRLVRVKRKIQEAGIPYQIPPASQLAERSRTVQTIIYLIFNEGYAASAGDELVRRDLCAEAIRLGRLLVQLLPDDPENAGLLALMILHNARRDGRVQDGKLVTLEDQDRSVWKRDEIAEGTSLLESVLRRKCPGPYQLQGAIAALHAEAPTPGDTDWRQIAALYSHLFALQPNPVVALNHAVAVAMSGNWEDGLRMIDEAGAGGRLERYYLFHAARADILRRMTRFDEAAQAYGRAIELATNPLEREFLTGRLESVVSHR